MHFLQVKKSAGDISELIPPTVLGRNSFMGYLMSLSVAADQLTSSPHTHFYQTYTSFH